MLYQKFKIKTAEYARVNELIVLNSWMWCSAASWISSLIFINMYM